MEIIDKIIKSDVAPKRTDALWINTTDNNLYYFDEKEGWIKTYSPAQSPKDSEK